MEWVRQKPTVKAYIDDYNVIEKVRTTAAISHFSQNRTTYEVNAPQTERLLLQVKTAAADIGMVVNEAKTQLLCIHPQGSNMSSYIRAPDAEGERIVSGESLKILGFTFGRTPDVSVHTKQLIKGFIYKMWSMRHLKRSGMKQSKLLDVYKSVVRPTIDFAAPSYHCLLTKNQSEDIERLQLRCMKIVFGATVSYPTVLESGLVEPLYARRENQFKRMALKTVKQERFEHWFPKNPPTDHDLRRRETYLVPKLRTERARKSPIIQMRRFLNSVQ